MKGYGMATTTTTILPAPVQQTLARRLLSVPTPNLIHKLAAEKHSMPAKGGTTKRYRRYQSLGTAKVPLGNQGVTPPPRSLTAVDIDAKIDFYGAYIALNDQVTLQNEDPKMDGVSKPSLIDLEAYGALALG